MAESKPKAPKRYTDVDAGIYKDYSIRWLKKNKDEHPEGHLVDEYEAKYGEVK